MGPRFGPPRDFEYEKVKKPEGIKDVPRYLKELLGGFFYRYGYIFMLVWKSGPWILILLFLFALLKGVLPVLGALISKHILNELQGEVAGGSFAMSAFWSSGVVFLLGLFFLYQIFSSLMVSVRDGVTRVAGEKVARQVKVQIMEKTKEIDLASFDLPAFYEKLENANREASMRPLNILTATFNVISAMIEFVGFVVVLLTVPELWWMVFVIVVISVPSAVINFIYRRKNFRYMRHRSKDRRQMNYYANLTVDKDLAKEVRIFDLTDTFIDKYQNVFEKYFSGIKKLIVEESLWFSGIAVVSNITNFFLYALIVYYVMSGKFLIGDYALYTGAIVSISACVSQIISISANIYEGTLFVDNLIEFMKTEPTVVCRAQKPEKAKTNCSHTIEFQNVSFKYPGADKYVLKNINLKFAPGETVVLVGLNGAGKTTLIKLLTRLYDPTEGKILLDGVDLKDYDVASLYALFGIVFQDFGKYAFTVRENVSFGAIHKKVADERIRESLVRSNAEDFVDRLSEKEHTPLMRIFEQNGKELSIGQWQKIAIARAFYADADILILDEPTASLDPLAEQEIFNQFDSLRADKTSIFVSHRLSSATIASQIVVLENGMVVETGTHRELMEKKGKYHLLFSTQAQRYIEEKKDVPPTHGKKEE